MKVLHVPHHFFPEPVGGTEVFVLHLCRELEALGVANTIAAPGASDGEYQYEGFPVLRYRVPPELEDVAELYGEGNVVAAEAFGRILDQVRSDLVHLHAYNRGVSLRTLQAAKARGLPVVFTLHCRA
jgi:glycosyltransferase involved in cell wall biosynthesis